MTSNADPGYQNDADPNPQHCFLLKMFYLIFFQTTVTFYHLNPDTATQMNTDPGPQPTFAPIPFPWKIPRARGVAGGEKFNTGPLFKNLIINLARCEGGGKRGAEGELQLLLQNFNMLCSIFCLE
jgi:hypothetical protein